MSLRLALVIDGNATGAQKAAEQTVSGLTKVEQAAGSASARVDGVGREMNEAAQVANVVASALRTEGTAFSMVTRSVNENIAALKARHAAAINARMGIRDSFDTDSRATDIEAYGREMDALRAKYNPLFALEQRRAANLGEIDRAHRLGAISAREMANAVKLEEAAYLRSVAAINSATTALQTNQAVAAKGPSQFNTANIAAQLQDIAVTSAMGMSPLQIALQQGTQISAVFGNMGAAGAVKTLGAAFLSVISPVSLVTIGVTALAAMAIQAFGNIGGGADEATASLDDHISTIEDIARGYDRAIEAARDYIEEARKAPNEAVASNLGKERSQTLERYGDLLSDIQKQQAIFQADIDQMTQSGGPAELLAGMQGVLDVVNQAGLSANTTAAEFDRLETALTLVKNSDADDNIRYIAEELLNLVVQAADAQTHVGGLDTALRNIPKDIQIKLTISQQFTDAMGDLSKLYVDPRSRFDVAREQAEQRAALASSKAQTYSEATAVASEYQRVLSSIDAAEAEASAKSAARGSKQVSDYQRQIDAIRERTQVTAMENTVIGQSTFVMEKARTVLELENAARKDAIGLSAERVGQIQAEAHAYALAAAQQEQLREAQQAWEEQMTFYKGTFGAFFSDIKSGLKDGQSLWDAFGNAGANALDKVADRALSMAADGLFDMLFNAIGGAFTGGFGGIFGGGGLRLGYQAGVLHTGGSVAAPPATRMVPAALFDNAPRFHGGGNLGPGERPIIAMEGEEIGWPDQLARKYGGGFTFAPVNTFHMPGGASRAEFEAMLDERDRVLNDQFASRVAYALENPRRQ